MNDQNEIPVFGSVQYLYRPCFPVRSYCWMTEVSVYTYVDVWKSEYMCVPYFKHTFHNLQHFSLPAPSSIFYLYTNVYFIHTCGITKTPSSIYIHYSRLVIRALQMNSIAHQCENGCVCMRLDGRRISSRSTRSLKRRQNGQHLSTLICFQMLNSPRRRQFSCGIRHTSMWYTSYKQFIIEMNLTCFDAGQNYDVLVATP